MRLPALWHACHRSLRGPGGLSSRSRPKTRVHRSLPACFHSRGPHSHRVPCSRAGSTPDSPQFVPAAPSLTLRLTWRSNGPPTACRPGRAAHRPIMRRTARAPRRRRPFSSTLGLKVRYATRKRATASCRAGLWSLASGPAFSSRGAPSSSPRSRLAFARHLASVAVLGSLGCSALKARAASVAA